MSDAQTTNSYYINLRRKEAQVHSIIEAQYSLKEHLREIDSTQSVLERAPFVPAKDTLLHHGTLENLALLKLLDTQRITIQDIQAKLDRTIELILAHSEELSPHLSNQFHFPDPDTQGRPSFIKDRLVHLPLKTTPVKDTDGDSRSVTSNPSEYTPWDTDFVARHPPVDCRPNRATTYAIKWKGHEDLCAPRFPYKTSDEDTKFYCVLPPPFTVAPNLPNKSLTVDPDGNPYFKKLQVSDSIYNPKTLQFGRVLDWDKYSCDLEVTSHFQPEEALWKGDIPTKRWPITWNWGDFVISLEHFDPSRRVFAYVSPYTREDSQPFERFSSGWGASTNSDSTGNQNGWGRAKKPKTTN